MARRYAFPKRVRLEGDRQVAATFIPRAETLLGALVTRALEAGRTFARQRLEENGVTYDLVLNGISAEIGITVPTPSSVVSDVTLQLIWLPVGIVVYPAGDDSATGWGAPPLITSGTEFDKANTAPGVDHGRWTPGGKLGEVLLTPYKDANYPSAKRNTVPLFFERRELPTSSQTKDYAYAAKATWAAFRMEFDSLPNDTGVGGTARRAVFHALNVGRDYLLPIRGYYDPARAAAKGVVTADFGGSPWLTDGVLANASAGYRTAAQRKNKDGQYDEHAIESITRASDFGTAVADLESECDLGGTTFDQSRTTLSIGVQDGVTALDAVQHAQWVAYGTQSWSSSDPTVPVFSWAWPPGQLLDITLSLGTTFAGEFIDLDQYTFEVRGANVPLFGKRVYANGRIFGTCPDFVLSVGARKTAAGYRVMAVTWRSSDNPPGTFPPTPDFNLVVGQFNTFRVWFVDLVHDKGVWHATEPPIGVYDETTNPHGWRYAGSFTKLGIGLVTPGFDTLHYVFSQLWKFDRTGTKMIATVQVDNPFGAGPSFGTARPIDAFGYLLEAALETVGDGALSVTQRTLDFVPISPSGFEVFDAVVRAADYDDANVLGVVYNTRAHVVDSYQGSVADTFVSVWFWQKADAARPLFFGEGIAGDATWTDTATAFVVDAAYGAAIAVLSTVNYGPDSFGTWQLRVQVYFGGSLVHDAVAGNPDHVVSYTGVFNVDQFMLCLPVYARRLNEHLIGYELEPRAGYPVISGYWANPLDPAPTAPLGATTFYDSWFDFSAGNINDLVGVHAQTRLYPAGAV